MGNRAVIAFKDEYHTKENSPAIYLHWNGGRDSVEGFLAVAKKQYETANGPEYGCARLVTIICNFFTAKDGLSVGVGTYGNLDVDNYDNGTYWINTAFEIVEREYNHNPEQKNHDLQELIESICAAQPKLKTAEGVA